MLSGVVERFRGGANSMGDEASKFGSEAAKLGNDAMSRLSKEVAHRRLSRSPLRSVSDSLSGSPAVADRACHCVNSYRCKDGGYDDHE